MACDTCWEKKRGCVHTDQIKLKAWRENVKRSAPAHKGRVKAASVVPHTLKLAGIPSVNGARGPNGGFKGTVLIRFSIICSTTHLSSAIRKKHLHKSMRDPPPQHPNMSRSHSDSSAAATIGTHTPTPEPDFPSFTPVASGSSAGNQIGLVRLSSSPVALDPVIRAELGLSSSMQELHVIKHLWAFILAGIVRHNVKPEELVDEKSTDIGITETALRAYFEHLPSGSQKAMIPPSRRLRAEVLQSIRDDVAQMRGHLEIFMNLVETYNLSPNQLGITIKKQHDGQDIVGLALYQNSRARAKGKGRAGAS